MRRTLWQKVTITETCWLWTGGRDRLSYGRQPSGRTSVTAHRLVYELLIGPVPDGLELDHLCRIRHCVRPDHLEPVTHAENMRRARWTHCKHGHELTDENVYLNPRGGRSCRQCALDRAAARRMAGAA